MSKEEPLSLAKCNICSRYSRDISVICERRCLVCSRCQGNPVIKHLFVAQATSSATCPLCENPLSRTMLRWCIRDNTADSVSNASLPAVANQAPMGGSRTTNDLDEHKNPLPGFLKRFKSIYGYLGGVDVIIVPKRVGSSSGGTLTSADGSSKQQGNLGSRPPSQSFGNSNDNAKDFDGMFHKDSVELEGNSESKVLSSTTPNTHAQAPPKEFTNATGLNLPPKYTNTLMLEFAADCVCSQWQSILKNGNESMATMFLKTCMRKKMSQKTNDFKAKSVLDYFYHAGNPLDTQPLLILFGRICGILPRSNRSGYPELIRKAWGPVATSILVIAYCDRCWKLGELKDGDDNPKVDEVRTKLNKFTTTKNLSLKRCIKLLTILQNSDQPHWGMSPLISACKEYKTRMPWDSESVSRLLHIVFAVAESNRAVQLALAKEQVTQKEQGLSNRNSIIHHNTRPGSSQQTVAQSHVDILRSMKMKAKEFWSANARSTHSSDTGSGGDNNYNITNSPIKKTDFDYNSPQIIAQPEMGKILNDDNIFDLVNFSTATDIASTERYKGCTINVAILALICVESWEMEYNAMQYAVNRALVSATRRMAIGGTFDPNNASTNSNERRAILRILKWYANVFQREVDWNEVRELSLRRDFPFHVPESLLEKSTAELHYLATQIAGEWEHKRAREFAEDLAEKAGISIEDYAARIAFAMSQKKSKQNDEEDSLSTLYLETGGIHDDQSELSLNSRFDAITKPLDSNEQIADTYRSPVLVDLPYKSPTPARHTLNITDILDNDPALLTKMRLLSNMPIGPNASKILVKSLDEEILEVVDGRYPTFKQEIKDDSSDEYDSINDENQSQSTIETKDNSLNQLSKDVEIINSVSNSLSNSSVSSSERMNFGKSGSDLPKRQKNIIAVQAKGRVLLKIDELKKKHEDKEMKKRIARIEVYEKNKEEELIKQNGNENTDVLDVSNIDGALAKAEVSVENALAFERAVKVLIYKDRSMQEGVCKYVADGYLNPWQLSKLEVLDLSKANIKAQGAAIIAEKLKAGCCLQRLQLNGNYIGDTGCGHILNALVDGGGCNTLQYLELRRNNLTMINNSLVLVSNLVNLRHLSLASNCITLDNFRHLDVFVRALCTLTKLEKLNLSLNRIQDRGLIALQEDILPSMKCIEQLELKRCFITPKSFPVWEKLLRQKDTSLKKVQAEDNIITTEQLAELKYRAHVANIDFLYNALQDRTIEDNVNVI